MSEDLLGLTHYRSRRCFESQPNCQRALSSSITIVKIDQAGPKKVQAVTDFFPGVARRFRSRPDSRGTTTDSIDQHACTGYSDPAAGRPEAKGTTVPPRIGATRTVDPPGTSGRHVNLCEIRRIGKN